MINLIFTLDYEIYGNGRGSLHELVHEPTRELMAVFKEFNATFVVFAEAVEFSKMEEYKADDGITAVRAQLRELYHQGFEIGLHLHPWWENARRENGDWQLDWSERNLCAANPKRIDQVVGRAIAYLRDVLGDPAYTPASFRAGLWLMQPTSNMAAVLARHGIQVDSSVFKGGRTHALGLDYRASLCNGYSWRFSDDVNVQAEQGCLLEIPIYAEMVPFWKMLGKKRLKLHKKVPPSGKGAPLGNRWRDFARVRYPRKLDFCRMGYEELLSVLKAVIREDEKTPQLSKTIVAIGHSKDLVDIETIRLFLLFLRSNSIVVTDFRTVIQSC